MTTLQQRQPDTNVALAELALPARAGISVRPHEARASSDVGRPCSRGSTIDTVTSAASCPSTLQARRGHSSGHRVPKHRTGAASQSPQNCGGGHLVGPWSARPVRHGLSNERPRGTRASSIPRHQAPQQKGWATTLRAGVSAAVPLDAVPGVPRGSAMQAPKYGVSGGCQGAFRAALRNAAPVTAAPACSLNLHGQPQSRSFRAVYRPTPGLKGAIDGTLVEVTDKRTTDAQCAGPPRPWAAAAGYAPAAQRDYSAKPDEHDVSLVASSSLSSAWTLPGFGHVNHVHAPLANPQGAPPSAWMVPHPAAPLCQGTAWDRNLYSHPAGGHVAFTNGLPGQPMQCAPFAASGSAPRHDGNPCQALHWQSAPWAGSKLQFPVAPWPPPRPLPVPHWPARFGPIPHGHAYQSVSTESCQATAINREVVHPNDVAPSPGLAPSPHTLGAKPGLSQAPLQCSQVLQSASTPLTMPIAEAQPRPFPHVHHVEWQRCAPLPCYRQMQCAGNEMNIGQVCPTANALCSGQPRVGNPEQQMQAWVPAVPGYGTKTAQGSECIHGGTYPALDQDPRTASNFVGHGALVQTSQAQVVDSTSHSHAHGPPAIGLAQVEGALHPEVFQGLAPPRSC